MNPMDAIDVFVGRQLRGAWSGIEDRFLDVLGRAKTSLDLHHPSDRQPRHRNGFEYHDAGGDCVGGDDWICKLSLSIATLGFGEPLSFNHAKAVA